MGGGLLEQFVAILSPSERLRSRFLTEDETEKLKQLHDVLAVHQIWKRWRIK